MSYSATLDVERGFGYNSRHCSPPFRIRAELAGLLFAEVEVALISNLPVVSDLQEMRPRNHVLD